MVSMRSANRITTEEVTARRLRRSDVTQTTSLGGCTRLGGAGMLPTTGLTAVILAFRSARVNPPNEADCGELLSLWRAHHLPNGISEAGRHLRPLHSPYSHPP